MTLAAAVPKARIKAIQAGRDLKRNLKAWRYRGNRYEDPLCGGRFSSLLPSKFGRPLCVCPGCGSRERHRALWLYLTRETDIETADYDVLHFAPEAGIRRRLERLPRIRYRSVDLYRDDVTVKADITDLPFDAESVDLILCNHVLEHIDDDALAIRELARVLRPGGRAIMQHPVDMGRPTTFEDPSITDPDERDRVYGQSDHVRIYGRDFEDRLRAGGFDITESVLYGERLDPAERDRFRVDQLPSARPERDIEAGRVVVATKPRIAG